MKYLIIVSIFALSFAKQDRLQGAWESIHGDSTAVMIIADDYLSISLYSKDKKKFYYTTGGTVKASGDGLSGITEFNSKDRSLVGKEYFLRIKRQGRDIVTVQDNRTWKLIDDGTKFLSGNWRITQREQNGQLQPIHTSGPRKTIKILSSTRFQWAAINTETGEFSGTGGGTYRFENGIYTETIEFFSRDSTRVGMSLSFNGKIDKNDWYHSGKSSRGDPINEVWSRK